MSDTAQPLRKKKPSQREEKIVTTIQGDSSDSDEELTVVQAPPADAQTTMKFMQRRGRRAADVAGRARERALRQAVATHDLRSKVAPIYAALLASGDAGDSDAPADDKATLRMVGHYARFIDGEAW